jgi:hypothetical protein
MLMGTCSLLVFSSVPNPKMNGASREKSYQRVVQVYSHLTKDVMLKENILKNIMQYMHIQLLNIKFGD